MDDTPNLQLPYILAAQAQKHVTHNEAIRALDAIVQLSVLDRDLAAPPVSPAEGDRYIVAASGSGAWAGQDDRIAAYQDGAWILYAPGEGWVAWVADEDALLAWDGAAWVVAGGGGVNPTPLVGVNATADAANRLSLSSPASLFNHEGAGHQLKLNKSAPADTASLLYQTGFSGRAEMGLAGDDDFHVKVSADGAVWTEAIVVDKDTGIVSFPQGGSGVPGGAGGKLQYNNAGAFGGAAGLHWDAANGRLGVGTDTPTGQLEITKDLRLPATADATTGVVAMGGVRFLHAYGTNNLFLGPSAGNFTTTGQGNVALGNQALGSVTSGEFNFALGYRALMDVTSGSGNVAIGNDTLGNITTQGQNIAIGGASMTNATGVGGCVGIGYLCMLGATSAQRMTVIGTQAGQSVTSAADGTLVGRMAGFELTSGSRNTFVGQQAGRGITTGAANTVIGIATGLASGLSNNVILADGDGNIRIQVNAGGHAAFAGAVNLKSYTVGSLPSAAGVGAGGMVFVSDEAGGAVPAFSDGTDWRRVTDRAVVS